MKVNHLKKYLLCLTFALNNLQNSDARAEKTEQLFDLTLEQLLNVHVVSASKSSEPLREAPATIILLSRQDLENRGYENLSEIFDDLPGMEVLRPFGDTYFVNYMRGYRYTIGTPYLVLLDGVIVNSSYFSISTQMATFPLSQVKQVEVVYGPVSSVYGPNAFMGVINIISDHDRAENGHFSSGKLTYASDQRKITDVNYLYKQNDYRISLALRLEKADLKNRIDNETNYWLQDSLYQNSSLWGNFTQDPSLVSDGFSSYIDNKGFDLRLYSKHWEFASQYWRLDTGYGTIYPGDRIPANSTWPRVQYGSYLRYENQITETLGSKSLLRYSFDGITNDSYDIEAYNLTNSANEPAIVGGIELEPGETARFLFFSYWQTQNLLWEFNQDFELLLDSPWKFNFGFKYSYKDLQKAYDLPSSGPIAVSLADPDNPQLFPLPPDTQFDPNNRIVWKDYGLYIQSKYQLEDESVINAGVRLDHNSSYGSATTLRLGYVKPVGAYTLKLLYGEAFQEPTPRSLYGAWAGSGSDPKLKPEKSNTLEASLDYTADNTSHLLSLYQVNNDDTVVNFTGGAKNAGSRTLVGLDYHFKQQLDWPLFNNSQFWLYWSRYLSEKQQKFDLNTQQSLGNTAIGDLAKNKVLLGFTGRLEAGTQLTLQGRYIGSRKTVETNPIDKIGDYFILDAVAKFPKVWIEGLSVSLKISNLFNQKYYHPGIRDADAGDPLLNPEDLGSIGFSGQNNLEWNGSHGWYNSRLPQPERQISLSLAFDF